MHSAAKLQKAALSQANKNKKLNAEVRNYKTSLRSSMVRLDYRGRYYWEFNNS